MFIVTVSVIHCWLCSSANHSPARCTSSKARGYVAYVFYFLKRYVRTLTYSILAYVNKNRVRLLFQHQQLKVSSSMLSYLIKFRDDIFRYVTDLRKIIIISGLLTYLLTYLDRPAVGKRVNVRKSPTLCRWRR